MNKIFRAQLLKHAFLPKSKNTRFYCTYWHFSTFTSTTSVVVLYLYLPRTKRVNTEYVRISWICQM